MTRKLTYIWCPKCRQKVLQVGEDDGAIKIRTKIVIFKAAAATVVCRNCGTDVPVDISLGKSTEADLKAPRLVIGKRNR